MTQPDDEALPQAENPDPAAKLPAEPQPAMSPELFGPDCLDEHMFGATDEPPSTLVR
jgi:hypothetical protein